MKWNCFVRKNDQRSPKRPVEPTVPSTSCPSSSDVWRPGRMLDAEIGRESYDRVSNRASGLVLYEHS